MSKRKEEKRKDQKKRKKLARKKIYYQAKLETAHRKLTSSKHQVSAIGRDKSTGNKDSIFGMDINSPKLVKQMMPANLAPLDYEEAASCVPDVLSGKKGNDVSSESHAAAALGGAIMDVANRVSDNRRKDHQRTVPRDLNFNTKARHGQSQLVRSEDDFHKMLQTDEKQLEWRQAVDKYIARLSCF